MQPGSAPPTGHLNSPAANHLGAKGCIMSENPTAPLTLDVEIPTEDGGTEKKTLTFKSLQVIPMGLIRETRNNYNEQMWRVFEWAFSAEDLAILDQVPGNKTQDLLREMQKQSGLEVGESSASSTS